MRVCYILSTTSVAGGANRSIIDLMGFLQANDVECYAVLNGHGSMEIELNKMAVPNKVIRYYNSTKQKNGFKGLIKSAINSIAVFRIRRFLRKIKVDIVHNNSIPTLVGISAARLMRIPYICHVRENIWDGLGLYFKNDRYAKTLINHSNKVIYISNFLRESYGSFLSNHNAEVIYNGFYVEDYLESHELFESDVIRLLMVGVVNPQKGQMDAIKAVRMLSDKGRNVHLTILGDIVCF